MANSVAFAMLLQSSVTFPFPATALADRTGSCRGAGLGAATKGMPEPPLLQPASETATRIRKRPKALVDRFMVFLVILNDVSAPAVLLDRRFPCRLLLRGRAQLELRFRRITRAAGDGQGYDGPDLPLPGVRRPDRNGQGYLFVLCRFPLPCSFSGHKLRAPF